MPAASQRGAALFRADNRAGFSSRRPSPHHFQRSIVAMKRLAWLAAALALPLALAAQNATSPTASVTQPANGPADIARIFFAVPFSHWTIKPSELGLSWTSPSQCYGTSGGITFKLFSTSAPITIVDVGVPANTETVTFLMVS